MEIVKQKLVFAQSVNVAGDVTTTTRTMEPIWCLKGKQRRSKKRRSCSILGLLLASNFST
jgi:hypothetical protein